MIRRVLGVALATLSATLVGCGTTTVVTGPTTTAVGATTTVPSGTVDELLARLQDRAFTLSIAIVDGGGASVLHEIQALWTSAGAQLPRTEFVVAVDRQIDLLQTAVDRRRPADADKSARNLKALIASRR